LKSEERVCGRERRVSADVIGEIWDKDEAGAPRSFIAIGRIVEDQQACCPNKALWRCLTGTKYTLCSSLLQSELGFL
jgi:hypothetical protein